MNFWKAFKCVLILQSILYIYSLLWWHSIKTSTFHVLMSLCITLYVAVRLCRLVSESEDRVLIYHNLENARLYHGTELQCIEITPEVSAHWYLCDWFMLYRPKLSRYQSITNVKDTERSLESWNKLYNVMLIRLYRTDITDYTKRKCLVISEWLRCII